MLAARAVEHDGDLTVLDADGLRLSTRGRVATGSRVIACVRPEHVAVEPPGRGSDAPPPNALRGEVESVTRLGHHTMVEIDCGTTITACVPRPRSPLFAVGESVRVSIAPDDVHVIVEEGSTPP